jgi:hypothetical protein
MTTFKLVQFLYRIVLRLHPSSFRDRFQDEMLWVFQEQAQHEHLSILFLDALRSLLIQRLNASREVEEVQAGMSLEVATSSLSSIRMLQAAAGATALTIGFAFLLAKGSPVISSTSWPVPARRSYPSFCEAPVVMKHPARKDRFTHRPLLTRSR